MNDKYVIVEGFAGLGNRLRTVAAAIEYCMKTNRKLSINWCDGMFADNGVNAFNKFFEIYDFPYISVIQDLPDSFYPNSYQKEMLNEAVRTYFRKKELTNFVVRKLVNLIFYIMGICKLDNLRFRIANHCKYFEKKELNDIAGAENRLVFGGDLKRAIDADTVIFVDNVPGYKARLLREHVRLKPEIQKLVDDFVAEKDLSRNSLGIHIRATDKKFLGSLNQLIKKMNKFVERKDINKIFLCTDNKKVEELMQEHFKEKLITYPKYLPDSEQQGVHYWAMKQENGGYKDRMAREAVLDMFCLARTEYMLYQFGSTFSEISKIYHKNRVGGGKCKSWRNFQFFGF